MTINDFCDQHDACADGRDWALSTGCASMAELWERTDMYPEWRLWIATQPGVMSDRDLHLFACWCVRKVWYLLNDERSRKAVEVLERYANGEATAEELVATYPAAYAATDAACDASRTAVARAAADAAYPAAYADAHAAAARAAADAAYAAARDATYAVSNAAYASARAAAVDATCDAGAFVAARAAQAAYLIAMGNPFKEMTK